jgi:predicted MFS family arabinose efflux permease
LLLPFILKIFIGMLSNRVNLFRLGHRKPYGAVLIGAASSVNILLTLGVLWGIAWGFQETIFVALAMGLSDTRIAASTFALMMALSNIGTAIGEGVATGMTDNIGFSAVFWLLAGINLLTFPILWGLFKITPKLTIRVADEAAVMASPD